MALSSSIHHRLGSSCGISALFSDIQIRQKFSFSSDKLRYIIEVERREKFHSGQRKGNNVEQRESTQCVANCECTSIFLMLRWIYKVIEHFVVSLDSFRQIFRRFFTRFRSTKQLSSLTIRVHAEKSLTSKKEFAEQLTIEWFVCTFGFVNSERSSNDRMWKRDVSCYA